MTPWNTSSESLATAALKENFQVRLLFDTADVTYGFQTTVGGEGRENQLRVVYYSSKWGKDQLGLMSRNMNFKEFESLLVSHTPSSLEIYPKDHSVFSPPFSEKTIVQKIKNGAFYTEKKIVKETQTSWSTRPTFFNRLGYLVDQEGWVYDSLTKAIFGKISGQSPSRLFHHHITECPCPKDLYHVKVLKREPHEILSKQEYETILSKTQKGRAGEKNSSPRSFGVMIKSTA